jgi:integrase
MIERDLIPHFKDKDLRELGEEDLLGFVRRKLGNGQSPRTIETTLSVLRRVLSLAHRHGDIARNPALRLGEIMRRVDRRAATEVRQAEAWTREEVGVLLSVAREHDPRFAPLLHFLLATGARRGEALGLKWEDVDFARGRITIRRAVVAGEWTTPKSGKARAVAMPPALASELFDLLAQRRVEAVRRGWGAVPDLVFPSETGGPIHYANLERSWIRLRRRAQGRGVRPLKLHSARHTYASLALASGKSVRWVADQLGHSTPMLTLRTYAHAMREEEADLGFADFCGTTGDALGDAARRTDGAKRLYPAPTTDAGSAIENAPGLNNRGRSRILEHETGIEPATSTLATWCSTN